MDHYVLLSLQFVLYRPVLSVSPVLKTEVHPQHFFVVIMNARFACLLEHVIGNVHR